MQYSTGELPPCIESSFEKNGYCIVKKIDICKAGFILQDASRIDNSMSQRQSLLTGKPMGDAANTFA